MSPRAKKPKPAPPTFLIDTREQTPFPIWDMVDWEGYEIGKERVKRGTLKTGDYSVVGWEDQIAVERKSFDDFFGSVTFGRDRLLAEIERAEKLRFFGFVIESPLERIAKGHPRHHRFPGSTAVRTILSWQVRYPWVHWIWCDNRDQAGLITVRLLERFAMISPQLIPDQAEVSTGETNEQKG